MVSLLINPIFWLTVSAYMLFVYKENINKTLKNLFFIAKVSTVQWYKSVYVRVNN